MKIGVIADTHGDLVGWQKVIEEIFSDVDMIIHAGDLFNYGPRNPMPEGFAPGDLVQEMNGLEIPLVVVRGNCDSDVDDSVVNFPVQSPFALVQIGSLRIVVNHGDKLSDEEKVDLAKRWRANIFISGHTHRPKLAREGDVVFLNPGSPSLPKENPTVGLVEETDGDVEIKIIDVETGKVMME